MAPPASGDKKQQQQQQPPPASSHDGGATADQATEGSHQRNPTRMLQCRAGNTEVRNGLCRIIYRSEMDPRWGRPQFIHEASVDRSRLDSMNLQHLNPDIQVRNHAKCICTKEVNLLEDWYVQMHDGTVLCNSCTRCFRCRILCFTAGRKLNSIDGFVLCNRCMLSYGCYRDRGFRLKVQPLPRSLGSMEEAMTKTDANAGNSQATDTEEEQHNSSAANGNANSQATDTDEQQNSITSSSCANNNNNNNNNPEVLTKPRYREEGRRPLRLILYPDPRPENYGRPNYRLEAPPYLGVDRNAGSQACPGCNQQALAQALVVPGVARVYHERSFRCANCKRPMHMGYQLPMVQFQACNCTQQPQVWCTGSACQLARVAHHVEKNCHLEPVHPGGRPKRDVPGFLPRFDPAGGEESGRKDKGKKKQQQQQQQ